MKKWGVGIVIIVILAVLYFVELSKIDTENKTSGLMPTLDNLEFDEMARNWDNFYRVRAKIINGQHAEFSIPPELSKVQGKTMELIGAAVFFSPGCKTRGDKIAVQSFFIYPTLGLANACEHLPEVAMRWTVRINLNEDWLISRNDMINAMVKTKGIFRIDTEKPYESVFFLDQATVEFVPNTEELF